MGQVLTARKKYAEADELLGQSAEVLARMSPSGPNTQAVIKTRIELYLARGKPAQAKAQEALLTKAAAKAAKKWVLVGVRRTKAGLIWVWQSPGSSSDGAQGSPLPGGDVHR